MEIVDFKESYDGDLVLNDGDIVDTGNNYREAAYQIAREIINTKPGENRLWPLMGLDTDAYEGAQNNSDTGNAIARHIKLILSENSLFYPFEIEVEAYPVGIHSLAFRIEIITIPGEGYYYTAVYDTKENKIRSLQFNEDKLGTVVVPASSTKNSRQ